MHSQTVKLGSPPTNRHIFLSNQQHLASDRRDWETQGDKPGAGVTASGI